MGRPRGRLARTRGRSRSARDERVFYPESSSGNLTIRTYRRIVATTLVGLVGGRSYRESIAVRICEMYFSTPRLFNDLAAELVCHCL